MDTCDITKKHGHVLGVDSKWDLLKVFHRLDVAETAHHELGLPHLDHAPADVIVGALDGRADLR